MIILFLSYDIMSLIIQLLAMLLIAVYGMNAGTTQKAVKFGIQIMLITVFFSHGVIAGPGPSFFPALVSLPVLGGFCGWGSAALTRFLQKCPPNQMGEKDKVTV